MLYGTSVDFKVENGTVTFNELKITTELAFILIKTKKSIIKATE